jgi:hypothetical protein
LHQHWSAISKGRFKKKKLFFKLRNFYFLKRALCFRVI